MLRFLRQRERLSQRELAATVGYSDAQINRLESGSRIPDPKMVAARFIPALHLNDEHDIAVHLIELAGKTNRKNLAVVVSTEPTPETWQHLFVPATNLIGRGHEVVETLALLSRANVRLITLIGPPGVGKTRLAIEIAHEIDQPAGQLELNASIKVAFADGVCIVPLAPVLDVAQVTVMVAQSLGVQTTQADPLPSLKLRLRDRQMLLVLDNFEHLIDAATIAAELLSAAPELKILVTSRIALNLSQEFVVDVRPLAIPEAMQLFTARAMHLPTGFEMTPQKDAIIHEICHLLDGLPLAIELAATKLRAFSLRALCDQLTENRLGVLRDGPRDRPYHQRTLRDTIAWSYRLLTPEQQRLLRYLSVFAGGCSLAAIVAIADPNQPIYSDLQALIDGNLVVRDDSPTGEPRYGLLALIREYAAEQLRAQGQVQSVCQAHAHHYLDVFKTTAPYYDQRAKSGMHSRENMMRMNAWLADIRREHANLIAVFRWSLGSGSDEAHDPVTGAELALLLYQFWWQRGPWQEADHWMERAIVALGPYPLPLLRAKLQTAWALFVASIRDPIHGERVAQEAVTTLIASDDLEATANALMILGAAQLLRQHFVEAQKTWEKQFAIGHAMGDQGYISMALYYLGEIALFERDLTRVAKLCQQYEEAHDVDSLVLNLRGMLACCQGNFDEAEGLCQRSLAMCQEDLWVHGIAATWQILADISFFRGDIWHAYERFIEGLRLFGEDSNKQRAAWCLTGLAAVIAAMGNEVQSVTLWSMAEAIYASVGYPNRGLHHDEYQKHVMAAQSQLHPHEQAMAVSTGRATTFENAIEYALFTLVPNQSAK